MQITILNSLKQPVLIGVAVETILDDQGITYRLHPMHLFEPGAKQDHLNRIPLWRHPS